MTKKNTIKRVAKNLRKSNNFKGLRFIDSFRVAKRLVDHYGLFNPLAFYDFSVFGFDVDYNSHDWYFDADGFPTTTKADAFIKTDWGSTFHYTFG